MSGRTFEVEHCPPGFLSSFTRQDFAQDQVHRINVGPEKRALPDGGCSISIGFPLLLVSPCVRDPGAVADQIARVLNDNQRGLGRELVQACRDFVADELEVRLRSFCSIDDGDRPVRASCDPEGEEIVAEAERLLAAIDRALSPQGDAA